MSVSDNSKIRWPQFIAYVWHKQPCIDIKKKKKKLITKTDIYYTIFKF